MNLNRIGLIVNPQAGGGAAAGAARAAVRALAPREVWAGAGEMGADALAGLPAQVNTLDWSGMTGKTRTAWVAKCCAAQNVDALVVCGGDGTLADVALAVQGSAIPLLGIGAGTANVGPLITCNAANAPHLADAELVAGCVDGLLAGVNGAVLGLGFNDVVVDFTVLATLDGRMVNVDAASKMQGLNAPRAPSPIGRPNTKVIRASAGMSPPEIVVAEGEQIATLIVGLPDQRFYGKAIAGGVLLSGIAGDVAGCLTCSHLLIRTTLDVETHRRSEPVVSRYAGLAQGDELRASGFCSGAVLCADGNPLHILSESDVIHIRPQRALARCLKFANTTDE